jgi:acyl-coenzyme A thioesterase PaaI-like protein
VTERAGLRTSVPEDAVVPPRHPAAPASGEQIASHYHRCVGCGHDHPTGLRVVVTAGEGLTLSGSFTVTEDHQGAPGLAHGGMLALAFDEVLGSLIWLVGMPAVTGHLETDFRRPVPVGTTLHITARVDGQAGRRLYTSAIGRADDADGPVAVQARAVFVVVSGEHFRAHGRREDVEAAIARDDVRHAARSLEVNP